MNRLVFVICEQAFKCTSEATATETVGDVLSAYSSKTVWRHHPGVCGGKLLVRNTVDQLEIKTEVKNKIMKCHNVHTVNTEGKHHILFYSTGNLIDIYTVSQKRAPTSYLPDITTFDIFWPAPLVDVIAMLLK